MAIAATMFTFDIDLADADRQVYETLALRVARHPSESEEYLVARVLAYAMEHTEGIAFSRGVSEPAILNRCGVAPSTRLFERSVTIAPFGSDSNRIST